MKEKRVGKRKQIITLLSNYNQLTIEDISKSLKVDDVKILNILHELIMNNIVSYKQVGEINLFYLK